MDTDLSVIIPCYNEAENVARMAETLFPVVDALATYADGRSCSGG